MIEVIEIFDFQNGTNTYTVTIYSTELNNTHAFFAKIKDKESGLSFEFADHNDMVYYFTEKEALRERIVNDLSSKSSK